ncbi:MAG: flavodoxin-dependent (E)-4-hydroxy-3-methylbut-2-enyl-diphosphate synthase [Planctomycetota bacterium]
MEKFITRRKTRPVFIGPVQVGGGAPVSVQSMTKTPTEDIKATVQQIRELEELGCQIIRIAIPRLSAARALGEIKKQVHIPIETDIHFNPNLALESIAQGADAVRLNPGNITNQEALKEIVKQARAKKIPIRVGLNSGSIGGYLKQNKKFSLKMKSEKWTGWKTMVKCALEYCHFLESLKFRDIMVSLKASDVISTVNAYRLMADQSDYPFHLGVTAAGPLMDSTVKSAIGIGTLLMEGIGDTIRVSITGSPHDEVRLGYQILEAVGLGKKGPEIIACPTCARCEVDIVKITEQIKSAFTNPAFAIPNSPLKVAIMGCVVNGPGEATEADIGIAAGRGFAWLFKKGRKIRKIAEDRIVTELLKEIKSM